MSTSARALFEIQAELKHLKKLKTRCGYAILYLEDALRARAQNIIAIATYGAAWGMK